MAGALVLFRAADVIDVATRLSVASRNERFAAGAQLGSRPALPVQHGDQKAAGVAFEGADAIAVFDGAPSVIHTRITRLLKDV